ncbi:hypothetical protein DVH05_000265 [Phytophthora capsici]|nr:hypothetical protein DVH05_000265 [Phytophthora capsici]
MSDILLEPEDIATVAEALAFIDSCDGGLNPNVNGSTSGSDSGGSPAPEEQKAQKPKRKRRSKNPAGYSTRLLHRKKAEMQQLREEALRLEAQVVKLKHRRVVGVGALAAHANALKKKAESKWMEMAMIEFQRRQKAEYVNRKLREVLENQTKVDKALRAVVLKKSVLDGADFVYQTPSIVQEPLNVDNSSVIMAELGKKVSEMYIGSSSIFDFDSETPTISCEMTRRFDDKLGHTVEISSSASLSCPMEVASSSLWKELTTIRTYPDKSYRYMQTSAPNVLEKNFDEILRGNAGAIPVNGLQFMRKFEESERIVLTRAFKMLLPTDGVHLRASAWTIFSPSKSNPETSEVRAFVQLHMEIQPGFSARPEDIGYAKEVAFETWSLKMRAHAQYLQEVLIEAAAGAPPGLRA